MYQKCFVVVDSRLLDFYFQLLCLPLFLLFLLLWLLLFLLISENWKSRIRFGGKGKGKNKTTTLMPFACVRWKEWKKLLIIKEHLCRVLSHTHTHIRIKSEGDREKERKRGKDRENVMRLKRKFSLLCLFCVIFLSSFFHSFFICCWPSLTLCPAFFALY